jgi:hypothetical protein
VSNINEYLVNISTIDGEDTIKTFAYNHIQVVDLIVVNEHILEFNSITNIDTKKSWNSKPGSLKELRLLRNKIKNKENINLIENINEL